MTKKWIFTDVDGTLLHPMPESGMPESCREAIERVKEVESVALVITTGRSLVSARLVLAEYFKPAWHFPGIYSDGLVVLGEDEEDVIYEHAMDPVLTQGLASTLKAEFPQCNMFFGTRLAACFPELTEKLLWFANRWQENVVMAKSVAEIREKTGCSVIQVALIGEEAELDSIQGWLEKNYGHHFRVFRVVPYMISIMRPGWSKWEGIKKLAEHYNVKLSDCATIGDGTNDIEMLRFCDNSVAMGNACIEVQRVAKKVAARVEDNGWAEAVSLALKT
eukprot:Blabericola_migrator_1__8230@NODE_4261_length_1254_cov_50_886268_g2633_i0_p1_GENE_NODE_4261_length_1254_cov_50_886268_g2633_i0NODE_4261_length_1254_cov_50_886268_g2633_i0_p1_ORF_typecomplete_len277_score43_96Hydrolase_3/PF08282_12/9_4e46S6PP/PF05116_13/11S6PP/PF05116_13/2_1e06Trehalose_PPase/PF02358_16/0_14Trehalose_PPase/PF02358_16/1_7HAD/PF12710_7/2_9e02HAD/PF12710_7/0_0027T6SS_VasJ/PF16989_5/0_072HAD_2/PF13419_6/83HAD_2/PF13419_6/5_3Hydrolase/PF00702_26/2_5e03Hydrolase/PF00702_26/0_4_NODE_426